jgi:hypothetical protein
MTHILMESAWWLLVTQINAVAWFKVACLIAAEWAALDWANRL